MTVPPWLLAMAIAALLVAAAIPAAVRIVRAVMPQDSGDRLKWWQERRAFDTERVAGARLSQDAIAERWPALMLAEERDTPHGTRPRHRMRPRG